MKRLTELWRRKWLGDEEYQRQLAELSAQRPTPLFWLLGKTGSGKTSLIRFLTGADDAQIGDGFRPQTKDSRQFDFPSTDAPLLRFLDTRGLGEARYDPTEDLRRFDEQAHLIVVTARLLDHALADVVETLRLIRKARPTRPVLLVLTCLHEAYPQEQPPRPDPINSGSWPELAPETVRRNVEEQRRRFEGLVDDVALVDFTHPDDGFELPYLGGEKFTDTLVRLLPAAHRQTLVSWTEARSAFQDLQARRVAPYLLGYSLAAASAAAVPLPWVDLPIVFAIQASMVKHLAHLHGQPATSELLRALGPLSGRVLLRYATRELLKFIPFVGQATNAALAFIYTYGMGRACCWYFTQSRDGHIPSADDLRDVWQKEMALAREIWEQRQAGKSTKDATPPRESAKKGTPANESISSDAVREETPPHQVAPNKAASNEAK